ncbi:Protein SGT1 B [Vanrija pseudolonga]|uniref:Protein SGT1 B n=1 Tax=Vanrija pseudolonga TaxID=143232 RepID=A0AAF0YCS0_9TREE|nr:Protein SGT1 B [Vanrija pseudolonga]
MTRPQDIPLPRYDFYQSPVDLTVSLYIKGYGASPAREQVKVHYFTNRVEVVLPPLNGEDAGKRFELGPLVGSIVPGECSERVLGTKIELKLTKDEPGGWTDVVGTGSVAPASISAPPAPSAPAPKPARKNWDKFVDDDDDDKEGGDKDPNAGGDAALQKLFAGIYANADPDTRKAMIKSYTESGGTSLSTDWSQVGTGAVPVRPPDGMEARKY